MPALLHIRILVALLSVLQTLSWNPNLLSRRCALKQVVDATATAAAAACFSPNEALALVESSDSSSSNTPERQALLSAINLGADDTTVLSAVEALVKQDPSKGRGASADLLDGRWKLLWSVKAEAFSPLLQLPGLLKPTSYQYIGQPAAVEVGAGRIAQMLSGGVLGPFQLWLSSGVVQQPNNPSMLEIRPPFRLEAKALSSPKWMLVQAGSDADFRAVNARTLEAQQAPPNQYQQVYVEEGGPGALRISTIVQGDPVIVGAMFVHQKI